jgi:hypothetical protein
MQQRQSLLLNISSPFNAQDASDKCPKERRNSYLSCTSAKSRPVLCFWNLQLRSSLMLLLLIGVVLFAITQSFVMLSSCITNKPSADRVEEEHATETARRMDEMMQSLAQVRYTLLSCYYSL